MSSRREKEKRIRPRNNPYKRDKFDQSKYLHVKTSGSQEESENKEHSLYESDDFEEYEEYEE